MVPFTSLALPIFVSAVFVFLASSLSHAVLRFHRADYGKVPGEGEIMDLLRKLAVSPGDYLFPLSSGPEEMKSAPFQEKWKKGPVGLMTVLPNGGHPMGRTFGLWFLYCMVVGAFAAFVAGRSLAAGAPSREVFILVAFVAAGAHILAYWPAMVWNGKALGTTLRSTADGIVYGILTGAAFVWLWPR